MGDAVGSMEPVPVLPNQMSREWAFGSLGGAGVRVAVVDSGIERGHPVVGEVQQAVAVADDGERVIDDEEGDLCGHGTACAGIIRSIAPHCELVSVRVLGAGYTGSGPALLRGLQWAVEEGCDVINMSLSTTKSKFAETLHELADRAYFQRTNIVASAHNMPVESYPWRFSSVISVGSHDREDPLTYFVNPAPPVEFFARGMGVDVAWLGGGRITATGNSFAAPHLSGIVALIRSAHRMLTPVQMKTVLAQTANNADADAGR
ncbi:MAG TPA: S8 family serine peptidase [Gaiellales bacterium]|nr:S8 family serine peptidase [Gaiellales bacterium]